LPRSPSSYLPRANQVRLRLLVYSSHIDVLLSTSKVINDFDYTFAENGLTAFKNGKALPSQSFIKFVGEERYKAMVKFILHYIADLDIPIKRCVARILKCGT
jgi:hypothetical protein